MVVVGDDKGVGTMIGGPLYWAKDASIETDRTMATVARALILSIVVISP